MTAGVNFHQVKTSRWTKPRSQWWLRLKTAPEVNIRTALVHIGFSNIIAMNKVVAIGIPNSAPTRRIIRDGRDKGLLIDMTNGRLTKAVVFTDSGHIILAALAPDTISERLQITREGLVSRPEQNEKIGAEERGLDHAK